MSHDALEGRGGVSSGAGMTASWRIDVGDCRELLAQMDGGSVQTCVTSPPYFGLRDYGVDGQLGLEATPDEFVEAMVAVFREVRRVLRDDGTLWLNLGDSYSGSGPSGASYQSETTRRRADGDGVDGAFRVSKSLGARGLSYAEKKPVPASGTKAKDLIGIPWMVAFALRADGWYLRSDIVWHKPNPMPESVTDRPTKAHEYLFLLAKSSRYFYDVDAIREDDSGRPSGNGFVREHRLTYMDDDGTARGNAEQRQPGGGRNKRDVWTVPSQPFAGAHFATFPPKLIEPCILAGAPEGGVVLDPFAGAGTTGLVALRHNRSFVGLELNPEYAELARDRIRDDAPLLNTPSEVAARCEGGDAQ